MTKSKMANRYSPEVRARAVLKGDGGRVFCKDLMGLGHVMSSLFQDVIAWAAVMRCDAHEAAPKARVRSVRRPRPDAVGRSRATQAPWPAC